ncbi:MAG: histidine kinase dimerization/phospho-acceptor domain-containing protein [Polynucleobacter sp.]|uniref:ATP-binding protein n=1 Tax=Polynucleobacter sp. TaxID=2029855 RepID=UPI00271F7B5B|nr:ATP-binding protein [Polynucleobacter sp.]MDO8713719.1 histidine kinase dimerization/phospho-acceptor domain-containing protein [Polynucleobacter sp.]
MSTKHFSLRNRLLIWVLGSIAVIWSIASALVWYDAKLELEDMIEKIISNKMGIPRLIHEKEELLDALLWGLIWPLIIGLPILAMVVSAVIFWSNRSFAALSEALSEKSINSIEPITLDALPSELKPVLAELNVLLCRLANAVEKEKRFIADAAHELRTPIAAIRAQSEVLGFSPQLDPVGIENLIQGCDRASRLINQLLALSRIDSEKTDFKKSNVNLHEITSAVIADLYDHIEDKKQEIELTGADTTTVLANKDLLAILLRNLVDNASRYTPAGGRISIDIKSLAISTVIIIEDSGPGLEDEIITRLGERFFRGSTSEFSAGSGLGWSIIKQIARVEKVNVLVEPPSRFGGLKVEIIFS